jgi:hypothetical protein
LRFCHGAHQPIDLGRVGVDPELAQHIHARAPRDREISAVAHLHDVVLVLLDALPISPFTPERARRDARFLFTQQLCDGRRQAAAQIENRAEQIKGKRLNITVGREGHARKSSRLPERRNTGAA